MKWYHFDLVLEKEKTFILFFLYSKGARAESASRGRGNETEGVQGLKSLGVRDLHHKMAFLACNVLSGTMRIGDEAADNNEEASPATIKVIFYTNM